MADAKKGIKGRLGILVGGGPAPGINGVISAATIEAIEDGIEVIGIYDGFQWLMEGDISKIKPLTINDVSRIHFDGGSILRTSRANPTKNSEAMQKTVESLKALNLNYLVTIGGDDTAFSANKICEALKGSIKVVHVPKTIDNDLPLPGNMPTFGFETARHVGTQLVANLMEDSRTTSRWYIVVAMGRKAGHLALGIGKAAAATLTIIGEEFPEKKIGLDKVCDILEGAIIKRKALGREDGVAVVAEGIGEKLDPEELQAMPGVEVVYDSYGHLRLAEVPLANVLKRKIEERFACRGEKMTLVENTLGYELRCAPPIPFDCEYVRDLGYGAVRYLLTESDDPKTQYGAMIYVQDGRVNHMPFSQMLDPKTGKTTVRLVDMCTESYAVARNYMIRLEKGDFENPELLSRMAKIAKTTPKEFRIKFGHVVGL